MSERAIPIVGEERTFDDLAYRCFESKQRCSLWISAQADLVRLYHDTGMTRPERPRCDVDGIVRCGGRFRLERALADAWLCQGTLKTHASTIEDHRFPTASNVEYRGVRHAPCADGTRLAPFEQRVADALGREDASIEDVVTACGVSHKTAWSYVSRLISKSASVHEALAIVHPTIAESLRDMEDVSGSLTSVYERVAQHVPGDVLADVPCVWEQLRVARAAVAASRQAAGLT